MRAICAWSLGFWLVLGTGESAVAQRTGESAVAQRTGESAVLVAQGLSAEALARVAAELGSDDAGHRQAAFRVLTTLHAESLPGIARRLEQLAAGGRPSADDARAALTSFRHALGSRRADDDADLSLGVLKALAQGRSEAQLAMAEPLLLLRSLEGMPDSPVGPAIAAVFLLDEAGVWSQEARLVRSRGGLALLPTLIRLRSHPESRIRKWAQASVRLLGMDDPKVATTQADPKRVAQVVTAYGDPLDFPAMPVVVRLVGSPSLQVRQAARATVASFGKNAIWQLRELYQEVAGQAANRRWDATRTASELYAKLDAPKITAAERLLQAGMAAFVGGDLQTMATRYDELLSRFPTWPAGRRTAPGYAALGQARMSAGDLDGAHDGYRRALRLDPEHADAAGWRAQLAFVVAERSLVGGAVDLGGYERALAHHPGHAAALDARDRITGARAARLRRNKKLAAGAAVVLLFSFLWLLSRERRAAASATA